MLCRSTHSTGLHAPNVCRRKFTCHVGIFTERLKVSSAKWMALDAHGGSKRDGRRLGFALRVLFGDPRTNIAINSYLLGEQFSNFEHDGFIPSCPEADTAGKKCSRDTLTKDFSSGPRRAVRHLKRITINCIIIDGIYIDSLTLRLGISRRSIAAVRHWDPPASKDSFSSRVNLATKASASISVMMKVDCK